jgi:hypothetical protein
VTEIRVGANDRPVRRCARCHQEKPISGRGLCSNCYYIVRNHGELWKYPAENERRAEPKPKGRPFICSCDNPKPRFLGAWQTYQCDVCGYPMADPETGEIL